MKTIKGYIFRYYGKKPQAHYRLIFLFCIFLPVRAFLKDYGVSWDEKRQRDYGLYGLQLCCPREKRTAQ